MVTKLTDIKHDKHEVDATNQILGRLATRVATTLVGKTKPYFVRHLDCGDFVTVTNASKVKTTGKKESLKKYTSFSGYPAGLKTRVLKDLRETKPERIIRHAVYGMLPNNKLRARWMARLEIKS